MTTFAQFEQLDAELEAVGFPPTTPWWRAQLRRLYEHPTARRLVARVGRGGIKSTTAVKFALAELLFGNWNVPLGERHFAVFVSVRQDEAGARLRQAEAMCRALGIPARLIGDELRFDDMPLAMKVLAASVASVSGPRAVCKVGDELAKWTNADHSANPAPEVVASLRAMSVTHRGARELLVSSALSTRDYHFEQCALGDTRSQIVAEAPTWEANPSITEAQTRELEPDERVWRREYAAIPQAGNSSAFDHDAVERAFEPPVTPAERGHRVIVLDPSSGRKDAWTWGIAGWAYPKNGASWLQFDLVDGIEGGFFRSVSSEAVVQRIARLAELEGIRQVHSDQREAYALESLFTREGLAFEVHDWTSASKPEAVEKLRRWLAEGRLALPQHRKLRNELLAFEERITPSGAFTFGARGSGHDDYVALLLTAVMAIGDEADGGLAGGMSFAEVSARVSARLRRAAGGSAFEPPLRNAGPYGGTRWGGTGRGF